MGPEGIVSKPRDSACRAGRSDRWIKVKNRGHPAFTRVQDTFGQTGGTKAGSARRPARSWPNLHWRTRDKMPTVEQCRAYAAHNKMLAQNRKIQPDEKSS
jgi:hypothetical protein